MTARSFELFVARRYLRAKRKQAVISVITVISIAGVAAGVMALVIALAINNGFRLTLQRSLLGATTHVQIMAKNVSEGIQNWRDLDPKLRRIPGVVRVSPGLYGPIFLSGLQPAQAVMKGIPLDAPPDVKLKQGSFDGLRPGPGLPGIVLGSHLAESTGMLLNSVVRLINPRGALTPFGPHVTSFQFRVVGIFETGFYEIDNTFSFTSLRSAQQVFNLSPDTVNTIDMKLDDIYQAPRVSQAADKITGPSLTASTWMEQFHAILSALATEKLVTAISVGLIQLIAALNILITLIMMVMEKNRDIAILMSMGARHQQIRRIFMAHGLLIGVIGVTIGLVLGYSVSYLADRYRWLPLDPDVYAVSYVPFAPRWQDGLWIAAAALFVSFVATLYPARNATRIAPAEALRYE